MKSARVFEVIEVTLLEAGYWFVGGQAQNNIKIGDILVDEKEHTSFQVTAISTYGHNLDELVAPLTGYLTLGGENGDMLKTFKYLYSTTDI